MAQTTTPCPRCGKPMVADVKQVFDLNQDPLDKERLLRGAANVAVCPSCGYQSPVTLPMVYHDPDKELLLTYFPSEMGVPLAEQEKILGPLIAQVVNNLPPEKKKGYLFQPQAMLTYDTLIEKILEADGITKEMLNEQKYKVNLLKQMLSCAPESLEALVIKEESHIDKEFFGIFNNLEENILASRDKATMDKLNQIQTILFEKTAYGKQLKTRMKSTQKAIKDVQNLGENLNQDTLLDLVLASPDDDYLKTLAGLGRNGMDYTFFTKLSGKIEQANEPEKTRYTEIREKLLDLTKQIDAAIQEEMEVRKQVLEGILQQPDLEQAIQQAARAIDQTFLTVAQSELETARKAGDFVRSGRIQQMIDIINKLSTPPKEVDAIEKMLAAENEDAIREIIKENPDIVTEELKSVIASLISEEGEKIGITPEIKAKLEMIQKVIQ